VLYILQFLRLNNYISQYGNVSHILNININNELCDNNEKNIILSTIYDIINDKKIVKSISNTNIHVKWRVSDKNDLLFGYITSKEAVEKFEDIKFLDSFKNVVTWWQPEHVKDERVSQEPKS
jgi:hypothetical protein